MQDNKTERMGFGIGVRVGGREREKKKTTERREGGQQNIETLPRAR